MHVATDQLRFRVTGALQKTWHVIIQALDNACCWGFGGNWGLSNLKFWAIYEGCFDCCENGLELFPKKLIKEICVEVHVGCDIVRLELRVANEGEHDFLLEELLHQRGQHLRAQFNFLVVLDPVHGVVHDFQAYASVHFLPLAFSQVYRVSNLRLVLLMARWKGSLWSWGWCIFLFRALRIAGLLISLANHWHVYWNLFLLNRIADINVLINLSAFDDQFFSRLPLLVRLCFLIFFFQLRVFDRALSRN